ncbi:plasmid pRiA4b ORF-3 family protein [Actinomycetospora chiangmaiensis]|uniref:plasmid pRiA4b ORF-3 family protein n=1 Tax=Actinomycetospora chiangmaiensis TaxID=402650 RepID=UPI000687CB6C|nr:plasmid pRiA4b ORF-3 family protein [Actinomycetospora chiangmaiensis]
MRTVRLRVRLRDVEPAVERVIDVPSASRLPELHELLQAAMGWVDAHLHEFVTGDQHFGVPDPDGLYDQVGDETSVGLSALGPRWVYRYDFGDDWVHDVEVVGRGGDHVGCVDGRGSCPLEDCGGPPGHERVRAALSDPGHEDHAQYRAWVGRELPGVDRHATDILVGQVAGSVPDTVRLMLAEVGDGVVLTPGGRLPRRVVRALQQQRPHWSLSGKPAHTAVCDAFDCPGRAHTRVGNLVIQTREKALHTLPGVLIAILRPWPQRQSSRATGNVCETAKKSPMRQTSPAPRLRDGRATGTCGRPLEWSHWVVLARASRT